MGPTRRLVLTLAGALALLPAARALAEPHTRGGFFLGFGLGSGNASWTWQDGGRRGEWSGSGTARVGWALQNDLLLGAEAWGWAKDYAIETSSGSIPVEARLVAATLAATYFPGNAGFFLRGGLGVADAGIDVTPPAGVSFPVSGRIHTNGIAVLGAMGYEMRLTAKFALGAEGSVVYLGVDQDALDSAFGYGLDAAFNWYW